MVHSTFSEHEKEEGRLFVYGMRYYAPWLCRFTATDPLSAKNSHQSSYVYADNNPVTFIDVMGADTQVKEVPNKTTGSMMQTLEFRGDSSGTVQRQTLEFRGDSSKSIEDSLVNLSSSGDKEADNVKPKMGSVYQINPETGKAEQLDPSTLSKGMQDRIKGGREFIFRNGRLSNTSQETIDVINGESTKDTPLTDFALNKLKEDYKTFEGHFPEGYYADFSKSVMEKSIELNGPDKGVQAAQDLIDKDTFSEGYAILHAYESYVTKDSETGFDKTQHFITSAALEYKWGTNVTDIKQYGKEIRDEMKSWTKDQPGFDWKDMKANNLGQAYGRNLYKKHHPLRSHFIRGYQ